MADSLVDSTDSIVDSLTDSLIGLPVGLPIDSLTKLLSHLPLQGADSLTQRPLTL